MRENASEDEVSDNGDGRESSSVTSEVNYEDESNGKFLSKDKNSLSSSFDFAEDQTIVSVLILKDTSKDEIFSYFQMLDPRYNNIATCNLCGYHVKSNAKLKLSQLRSHLLSCLNKKETLDLWKSVHGKELGESQSNKLMSYFQMISGQNNFAACRACGQALKSKFKITICQYRTHLLSCPKVNFDEVPETETQMNYIDNTEATRKNYPTSESSQNHIERTEDQVIVEHNHNCRFIFEESKGIEGLVTPSYCIRFCDHIPSMWSYFVAVGSNLISIYKVEEASGGKEAELVQHYFDKDVDRNNAENSEEFYSCTWASDKNGNPVVAAGGKRRLIKVVNMVTFECVVLVGHGEYINELRTHPIDFSLILSAARDFSIRLWNIRTMTCIAIFSGEKGHFDNIISLDIHLLGNCFASCSTDTTIKIWSLNDPNLLEQIKKSDEIDSLLATGQRYKVLFVQAPLYTTSRVHTDYVDAVKWIGDCLLTKSTNNRIALWTPDALRYKQAPLILQEYHLPDSEIWFVKFDVCLPLGIFAVGNSKGKILIYPIVPEDCPNSIQLPTTRDQRERFQNATACKPLLMLSVPRQNCLVRQVSFSSDCQHLVASFEDGTYQLWSIEKLTKEKESGTNAIDHNSTEKRHPAENNHPSSMDSITMETTNNRLKRDEIEEIIDIEDDDDDDDDDESMVGEEECDNDEMI